MLYNSLVLPHFGYSSIVWSNTFARLTNPLCKLQARAGRIILGLPSETSSETVLRKLGWLSLPDRWNIQRAAMMFKVARGLAPSYLTNGFTAMSAERPADTSRGTRGSDAGNFLPPKSDTEWGRRRFASHGVFLWNGLTPEIKAADTILNFKNRIKKYVKDGHNFYSPN